MTRWRVDPPLGGPPIRMGPPPDRNYVLSRLSDRRSVRRSGLLGIVVGMTLCVLVHGLLLALSMHLEQPIALCPSGDATVKLEP